MEQNQVIFFQKSDSHLPDDGHVPKVTFVIILIDIVKRICYFLALKNHSNRMFELQQYQELNNDKTYRNVEAS